MAPKTIWTENIEMHLADMVYGYRSLWKVREEEDFGAEELDDISRIRESINNHYESSFTDQMIIKKWLEIRMLFDIKFSCNGFTLEDRGHHIRRDGSVKDDLNESWKLFKKLSYLVDKDTKKVLQSTGKEEKKKKGRPPHY